MKRIRTGLIGAGGALALALCPPAQAGNQKEEAMADSVLLALSHAVNDGRGPRQTFGNDSARLNYEQWLLQMSQRLRRKLPDPGLIETVRGVGFRLRG